MDYADQDITAFWELNKRTLIPKQILQLRNSVLALGTITASVSELTPVPQQWRAPIASVLVTVHLAHLELTEYHLKELKKATVHQ
jgi:hypothetical protein